MDAQNGAKIVYEFDTVTYLRRGALNILDAVAVQLPDVFIGEILPKLDLKDTLNLAQVSKAYRDAVWSVGGVQSMGAKFDAHKAHLVKTGKFSQVPPSKVLDTAPHPMYCAAKHGNLRAVRAFLQSGADVNMTASLPDNIYEDGPEKTISNMTPLFIAVEQGHTPCVMELIKAGADVNIAGSDGLTPLCMAALNGNVGCVVLLIQAGADVNMTVSLPVEDCPEETVSNMTPLFIAVEQGHTPCVMELIKAGADVNIARSDGLTPLYAAAQYGYEGCVVLLIQAGADVNIASIDGVTPLCEAVECGNEGCVVLLIQAGADIHKAANNGCTPLSVAVHEKHENIAALLRHFGGAR